MLILTLGRPMTQGRWAHPMPLGASSRPRPWLAHEAHR